MGDNAPIARYAGDTISVVVVVSTKVGCHLGEGQLETDRTSIGICSLGVGLVSSRHMSWMKGRL